MDDIFGRKIGSVFESGFLDVGSVEEFIGMLESLEEKWLLFYQNGKVFYFWFGLNKKEDFICSVISFVCQRVGFGCLFEKFIINWFECINGVFQDCVKCECGIVKIDEYIVVKSIEKLVKNQE